MILVLMGVSGSGKTTVGRLLAESLGWPFYDADDFHPAANIEKMGQGLPLNNDDRASWLDQLSDKVVDLSEQGASAILTCSCLKHAYRARLKRELKNLEFVYLKGDLALLEQRIRDRSGHFFRAELLASQFADLEEPEEAVVVNVALPPDALVVQIRQALSLQNGGNNSPRAGD